jgi:transcriptional regulator with XRE-family HTH domain
MISEVCGKLESMAGNPGAYFGTELQRERLNQGWSLDDLAKETGISAAHLSRIENGKRPVTEAVASACDKALPGRKGWFLRYWLALQTWQETPSWLKPWQDYELHTSTLRSWSPGVVDGLVQTEQYARAQIGLRPDGTKDKTDERAANRMTRQKLVLYRDPPPRAHFLVSLVSLRDMPRSLKAGQLGHLLKVAAMPNMTVQVVPGLWHAGMSGGFLLTDTAAWAEGVHTGQVHADAETVSSLALRFDSIRTEAMRLSESLALLREMINRERLAKIQLLKRQWRQLR